MLRPLLYIPLANLSLPSSGRYKICAVGPPASNSLLMASIYIYYLGWGWRRKRRASKVEHRGQYRAASTLGFLKAVWWQTTGPFTATWSPYSKAAWRASLVLLRSLVRGIPCFPCSGCSRQKVRGKGQVMGWFGGSYVWPGSEDEDIGLGRENVLGYPTQSDRYRSFLLLTWGGP